MKKFFLILAAISCIISSCSKADLPVDPFVGTYLASGPYSYVAGTHSHKDFISGAMTIVPTGKNTVWVVASLMPTFAFAGTVENGTLTLQECVETGLKARARVETNEDGSLSLFISATSTLYDSAVFDLVAVKNNDL